ncbi:MAG: hypothetical protein H7A19_00590 [Rhodanobacteraceae bacterium]|nr:hypothetical protein [Rhodanobacteraceae bacterium]
MSRVPPQRRVRLRLWALILVPAAALIWIGFKNISAAMPIWSAASAPTLTDEAEPARSRPSVDLAVEATEAADASVIEAQAKPVLPPFPAAIASYRAPAALRQQDRERFRDDPDLSAYAAELQSRANAGDADAAMMLSDLANMCDDASRWGGDDADLTRLERGFFEVVGFSTDQLLAIETTRRSLGIRCANWSASADANVSRLAESWAQRAAAMGHPGARLWAEARYLWAETPKPEDRQRGRVIGLELLQRRDPLDLLRYASTLSPLSPYEYSGFVMAACLLTAPCAADPLVYGRGSVDAGVYPSFPNYLTLNFLGPRDLWISERQAEEIVSLWQAGRFDLILPADLPSPGDGG